MANRQRDIWCSLIFMAFGVFMFVSSLGIAPIIGREVGSGFVPRIVAGVIIGLSVILMIVTLANKKIMPTEKADEDLKGGVFTILALAVYVALFGKLGFLLSTMLYLFVQITILSNQENRNFKLFAAVSVVVPLSINVLFVYVFKMAFPAGILYF